MTGSATHVAALKVRALAIEIAAQLLQAPGAELTILPDVSHFAPLQRPEDFNAMLLGFLERVGP